MLGQLLILVLADSAEDIDRFSSDEAFYTTFRKRIEQQMNENFVASMKGSHEQKEGRKVSSSTNTIYSFLKATRLPSP
jgi:hypothetical protein